jgi:hypothetical protein
MNFSIKQYSELPILKLRLLRDGRNDYKKIDQYLENSALTFSMKDMKTGIYEIANEAAELVLKNPCTEDGGKEYYIVYRFTQTDTSRPGTYLGEFKINFINDAMTVSSALITPISEPLYIHIIESFVKSDITFIP